MRQPNIHEIVKAIASETSTPADVVEKMYAQTWAEYSDGARIKDYLSVLVTKRVRENLQAQTRKRH